MRTASSRACAGVHGYSYVCAWMVGTSSQAIAGMDSRCAWVKRLQELARIIDDYENAGVHQCTAQDGNAGVMLR